MSRSYHLRLAISAEISRNAATAANSCSVENNGDFTDCDLAKLKSDHDFKQSSDVELEVETADAEEWSATAYWDGKKPATDYEFSSDTGRVEEITSTD